MEKQLNVPKHVAIILDGNGRWAKAKGMPRNYGHVQGAKTVETICEEVGIYFKRCRIFPDRRDAVAFV